MLWSAFILGLFGGMHCAGMCGPIALALPAQKSFAAGFVRKSLYNSGRVLTYSTMGAFAGLIGMSFNLAGWQQGLSIFLGVVLIGGLVMMGFKNLNIPMVGPVVKITHNVKKYFSIFLNKKSAGASIALGIINGFLPCGLVYIALTASMAAGSPESSALYMAIFGLGTFPMMLTISLAGHVIGPSLRQRIYKIVPVFVFTLGVLFILRGMSLGIPYISPDLEGDPSHSSGHIEMREP